MNAAPPQPPEWRRESLEHIKNAIRAGDLGRARRLAGEGLARGFEHPLLLNLRALSYEEQGLYEQALVDLRRAHILAPTDFAILNACGLCLARMERLEEALQCYDRVIALQPGFGPAWFNRGWALEQLGQRANAARSYKKAAEINPENAQAWANLSFLSAQRGDEAGARGNAERALAAQPGHPTAILALVTIELSDPAAAERRVRDLLAHTRLTPFDHALALGLLGDALDAQGLFAEAFSAYSESNALFRHEAAARFEAPGEATVAGATTWLLRWAESLNADKWRRSSDVRPLRDATRNHIFLIGFPRSGTTLIETVLANHPDVASLEERETFAASVRAFMGDQTSASRLAISGDRDLAPFRDDYWKRVKSFGVDPGVRIFIDKNPFNTLKLPLIQKLFPDARIIFSVRDPRDVVLSCFRRRFNLNASTYEFLDLKRAAVNYDQTMRFADLMRRNARMDEFTLVYEALVEDFTSVAQAACAFIGADWRPELLDVAARAKRGDVASASSAQIARGLFADGVGHWRRYRIQLAPILDMLAPWVERFGYAAD